MPKKKKEFGKDIHRQTKYDPMFIQPVKDACANGATYPKLCKLIGSLIGIKEGTPPPHNPIAQNTLNLWRHKHPDFQTALDEGRASHLGELALTAAKKKMKTFKVKETTYEVVNYWDPETKEKIVNKDEMVKTREVVKTVIPSDRFVMEGLEKTKSKQFANVSNVRMSGPGGGPIQTQTMTHDELIAAAKMRVKLKNGESIDDSGSSPEPK